jgi:hypothetical protein
VLHCGDSYVGIDLLFKVLDVRPDIADRLPPPREDRAANSSVLGGNTIS